MLNTTLAVFWNYDIKIWADILYYILILLQRLVDMPNVYTLCNLDPDKQGCLRRLVENIFLIEKFKLSKHKTRIRACSSGDRKSVV